MTIARVDKRIKGKEFVASLDECRSADDVLGLLGRTFNGDSDKMRERASHVSDSPQIVKLNATMSTFNAKQGKDTRHQDCMNMAAQRYAELTGAGMKEFKIAVNKYATKLDMKREKDVETKEVVRHYEPEQRTF